MKIFAHRGASKEAFQNTIEAFRKALEIGVDGIELDCLLSKDNEVVVTHYENLKTLYQQPGFVSRHTADDLRKYNICRLEEVLQLVQDKNITVIFDIKKQSHTLKTLPRAVAELAERYLPMNRILLSSFYWRHLQFLRRDFSHLKLGLILEPHTFKLVPAMFLGILFKASAIHPCLKNMTAKKVARYKKFGFAVHVWTVNTKEEMLLCQEMGVDGIFTDDSRLAKEALRHGR